MIWTLPTLPINSFLQKIFQSLRKPMGAKGCMLMSSNTLTLNCAELLSIHKHLRACHWSGKWYSDQVFDMQCLYHALSIHWWTGHVKDELCDQIKVITEFKIPQWDDITVACCLGLITGLLDEAFSDSLSRNVTKSDSKNVRV